MLIQLIKSIYCVSALISCLSGCLLRNPSTDHPLPVEYDTCAGRRSNDNADVRGLLLSDGPIKEILSGLPDRFTCILDNPEKYEIQILYTQVDRDSGGSPRFRHFGYRVNPKVYFNPASLVKLPVACLALQKINDLQIPGLSIGTRLEIGSQHACQTAVQNDPAAPTGSPTIAQYIRKALVVSDNDAYNRLYEFLGQEYINESLWRKGYADARIIRRFNGCDADENRYTNPFTFYADNGSIVYAQQQLVNSAALSNPLGCVRKGKGYIDNRGRYVPEPFDYTRHNYLSLQDIHTMLQSVIFPECFPDRTRFSLTPQDYALLRDCLTALPAEAGVPAWKNPEMYPDNYKKYFLFGDARHGEITGGSLRIFNVVGRSDGFISDCAYILSRSENIEFILSAVIYVNADEIMKDNKYEYNTLGLPFLAELGRAIYSHERTRTR